jgi:hypothetical protein
MVGGGDDGAEATIRKMRDDLEEGLAKLTKGDQQLVASLDRVGDIRRRLQSEGNVGNKLAHLDVLGQNLQDSRSGLEPKISLLRLAVTDPASISQSPEERARLHEVLEGVPEEMARVGHAIYLVDDWFAHGQQNPSAVTQPDYHRAVLG